MPRQKKNGTVVAGRHGRRRGRHAGVAVVDGKVRLRQTVTPQAVQIGIDQVP